MKLNKRKAEREANHKRLLISQNKLKVAGVGWGEVEERWGGWVMDTGEGMCYGECCELCKTDDSQTCTPEANNTLYVKRERERGPRPIFSLLTMSQVVF